MALRTQNVYPKWGQCLFYLDEEPITHCKATNENNMLRSGEEIINNVLLEMLKTWLTEIVSWALFLWSKTALTMQSTEGSKNEATSVLNESRKWIPLTIHDVSLEKSLTPWASTGRSECYRSYFYPEWTQIWYIEVEVLHHFWMLVSSPFYQNI